MCGDGDSDDSGFGDDPGGGFDTTEDSTRVGFGPEASAAFGEEFESGFESDPNEFLDRLFNLGNITKLTSSLDPTLAAGITLAKRATSALATGFTDENSDGKDDNLGISRADFESQQMAEAIANASTPEATVEDTSTLVGLLGAGASILGGLTGGGSKTTTQALQETGVETKQLQISAAGVDKIIEDVLGSEEGIAEIFSQENVAGIFDSSVAAQASGDLVANLVGEIAKLTAKEVKTTGGTTTQVSEEEEDEGFISGAARGLDLFRDLSNLETADLSKFYN